MEVNITLQNNKSKKIAPKKKYSFVLKQLKKNWDLYIIIAPVLIFFLVFHYFPMYGIQIAFKNFIASKGIWDSPWIGFDNFKRFFKSYYFWRLIKNTLGISVYQLAVGFPVPIMLALMMNEVRNKFFKKTVQMVTYAPHFLSTVVLVGMLTAFFSLDSGIVNHIIVALGGESIFFMGEPKYFKTMYVLSGVWKNAGWGSIVYMAALTGIDTELYEAASIDGASKFRRLWHITIPGIMPTAIILLIMDMGRVMNVGFEKAFLMQNNVNLEASEIISTYVYKSGILGAQYSFASAVDLFNSVINIILLVTVNNISRKFSETSLW